MAGIRLDTCMALNHTQLLFLQIRLLSKHCFSLAVKVKLKALRSFANLDLHATWLSSLKHTNTNWGVSSCC